MLPFKCSQQLQPILWPWLAIERIQRLFNPGDGVPLSHRPKVFAGLVEGLCSLIPNEHPFWVGSSDSCAFAAFLQADLLFSHLLCMGANGDKQFPLVAARKRDLDHHAASRAVYVTPGQLGFAGLCANAPARPILVFDVPSKGFFLGFCANHHTKGWEAPEQKAPTGTSPLKISAVFSAKRPY